MTNFEVKTTHNDRVRINTLEFIFNSRVNTITVYDFLTLVAEENALIRSIGDLQRFAVEWYYKNVLNRSFGRSELLGGTA